MVEIGGCDAGKVEWTEEVDVEDFGCGRLR